MFGFAKQSGGEVVQSRPGQGTTFGLYLPRVAGRAVVTADGPEPGTPNEGHGTGLLLVEDNDDVGAFASQALTELGYRTVLATDAGKALVEFSGDPDRFGIVFSDVMMPCMMGIDLAKEIRRRMPVVLV